MGGGHLALAKALELHGVFHFAKPSREAVA
jgi:hypothetical protein